MIPFVQGFFWGGSFSFFFWDCFQRNADACCPPGLLAKKVADVRLSARTYRYLTGGKKPHNSSSINMQPRSVWTHKSSGSLKQRKVIDLCAKTGRTSDAAQVSPEQGIQTLPACLSVCQPLWHADTGDISWNSTNDCPERACLEEHLTGERKLKWYWLGCPDWLWCCFSVMAKCTLLIPKHTSQ